MNKPMIVRTGIGQDSHRFVAEGSTKPCILGGLIFEDAPGLKANSDGDVIIHALCNAISSLTGEIILGQVADEILKREGITDSSVYLQAALASLGNQVISHVAITIEGERPKFLKRLPQMRAHLAQLMHLQISQIGITATTGEQLTAFGCGEGLQVFCIITTMEEA
ncbi:MAG: 2-C-methyl-D-erythritol 2,4-cyclodiphosphate synthase [Verrucomicrobia bacterium]|nr:2-C-methyl-D-erythritol 2,4-cyclodiphosphate synthase [Verrucomicrobiota bacterium]MBS0646560.1 2-C-methyl-D-erythritol 2,4-cyclodiphosphate synthase [Verrucomicrobiota bacterium]